MRIRNTSYCKQKILTKSFPNVPSETIRMEFVSDHVRAYYRDEATHKKHNFIAKEAEEFLKFLQRQLTAIKIWFSQWLKV